MDCKVIPRLAAPLNLPADLASVTAPETGDPAGMALTPPTETELASVPVKPCPAALSFELRPVPSVTDKVVPAGTTIGGGGGGGGAGAGAGAGAAAAALDSAGAAFFSLGAAAGAGWLAAGCEAAGSPAGAAAGCE